ncbi:MAG: hypothetical protein Q9M82_04130, partial [Mariprofundus sp.]|nr:hypothetical protein [Mariprofundus sp.]
YQRDGLDSLRPKERVDKGISKLSLDVQEAIIQAKKENPKRSIDGIIDLLESKGGSRYRRSIPLQCAPLAETAWHFPHAWFSQSAGGVSFF